MDEAWEGLTPPYATIVADPPWPYEAAPMSDFNGGRLSVFLPYSTMAVDEIAALPVSGLAAPAAHLFLWTTSRFLPASFDVLDAWGFRYIKTLTWCKDPMGHGGGGSLAQTTEFVLYGRRLIGPSIRQAREARGLNGNDLHRAVIDTPPTGIVARWERDQSLPPAATFARLASVLGLNQTVITPDLAPSDTTWWQWPRGRHSEKPAAFADLVERVSPGPYVELFARAPRLGWDSWGHGYEIGASA